MQLLRVPCSTVPQNKCRCRLLPVNSTVLLRTHDVRARTPTSTSGSRHQRSAIRTLLPIHEESVWVTRGAIFLGCFLCTEYKKVWEKLATDTFTFDTVNYLLVIDSQSYFPEICHSSQWLQLLPQTTCVQSSINLTNLTPLSLMWTVWGHYETPWYLPCQYLPSPSPKQQTCKRICENYEVASLQMKGN